MIDKKKLKGKIITLVTDELNLFSRDEDILISEVGDGNVNYIFRVESSEKSVIVKFADVFIRGSATRRLSPSRNRIEYQILQLQFELSQGRTVKALAYDPKINCIVMEDLTSYRVVREAMREHEAYPHFSENMANFLYDTLFKTTDLVMASDEKKKLANDYVNVDMCEISERLVFTEPYLNQQKLNHYHVENEEYVKENLYGNKGLHIQVAELKNKFMSNSQSLIHGDLHAGSIFIDDYSIKVFDPEFAFFGPMGYDIGNVMASLLISFITASMTEASSHNYVAWVSQSVLDVFEKFIQCFTSRALDDTNDPVFKQSEFLNKYLMGILSDSVGYTGTEIIRRTVGVAKVWDIEKIYEQPNGAEIERRLLDIGINLIMNRKEIHSAEKLSEYFIIKEG